MRLPELSSKSMARFRSFVRSGAETTVLLIMGLLVISHRTTAQLGEQREESTRAVEAGFLINRFQPRSDNTVPDSLQANFTQAIPVIGYRDGNLLIYLGYFSFNARSVPTTELNLVAKFSFDIRLTGKGRTNALLLPITITTDYLRVEGANQIRGDRFDVGSGGIGVGLKWVFGVDRARFSVEYSRLITYSTVSFSTSIGFSHIDFAEATIALDDILGDFGLIFGYRYRDQSWLMDNKKYNYFGSWHGAMIGMMF